MPFSERYNQALRQSGAEDSNQTATRWGIGLLTVLLLALIGFFFWYNNRSVPRGLSQINGEAVPEEKSSFFERVFSPSPSTQSTVLPDADADGLDDAKEERLGTDAAKADSDSDGLTDREEADVYKTDPRRADTDGDGMSDGSEIRGRRDPLNKNPDAVWPPLPNTATN